MPCRLLQRGRVWSSPSQEGPRKRQTEFLVGQLHKDFMNRTRILIMSYLASFPAYRCCLPWFICASVKVSRFVNCLSPMARFFLKLQIKVFVTFLLQQWLVIRLLFLKKVHPSSSLQFPFDFLVWQIAVLQIKTGLASTHFPPSLHSLKTHLRLGLLKGILETIWFNVFISEMGKLRAGRGHC